VRSAKADSAAAAADSASNVSGGQRGRIKATAVESTPETSSMETSTSKSSTVETSSAEASTPAAVTRRQNSLAGHSRKEAN
jgi:hypothetical protein